MNLVELTIAVHEHLEQAGIAHAFGGALALAYYGQPRATIDIDLNVFVHLDASPTVVDVLAKIGLGPQRLGGLPVSGTRFRDEHGGPFVDVFFTLDERQAAMAERVVLQPFGHEKVLLPFLSAEDVVIFKLSFGRTKDWADLEDVAATTTSLDLDYIEETLIALRGPTMYPRVARFRSLAASADPR